MSQMPSKVDVTVAVPKKTKKFFTQTHLTTHGFMKPRPIFAREYIPGRDMKVSCDSFIRANPLPVPVFGHVKVHNRAFFVPFRTVSKDFNAFYASTVYNYSNGSYVPFNVPFVRNNIFVNVFINSMSTNEPWLTANGTDVNITLSGVTNGYDFTEVGLHYFTVIESLGYKINWNDTDRKIMSALPLMCYIKVMLDWYYPSAYVGDSVYNSIMEMFNNPVYQRELTYTDINLFMIATRVITYNPDYFVNAWDTPTAPNDSSTERTIAITDVTNNSSMPMIVTNKGQAVGSPSNNNAIPSNGTAFVGGVANASASVNAAGVITQYVVDALRSLTSFTKRHQLAGVRVVDRYLAELGISLSSEILNRSMYIGSQEFEMEFYDVYSHADTAGNGGAPLGAYAGKGNGYSGSKEFSFDNGQEFGMFIIVNSLIPVIGYYQGQNRETLHTSALDFYHGDFDHMAVQAVSAREVYVPMDGSLPVADPVGINQHIFAFVPKYIEYNIPNDLQTGLYRAASRNGLLPMYSLMRDLSSYDLASDISAVTHSIGFVRGYDSNQYQRAFGLDPSKDWEDQFNAVHTFDVTYYDSTLPAYDTYEFEHEDNKKVTLDVNGSKLN